MSFIVTMRFDGDPKRANQVLRENPDLYDAVHEGIYRHGLIRCERFVSEDGNSFFDVDVWPSEEHRNAFVAATRDELRRWNELMGFSGTDARTWRSADPGEEF
jgi:hypothetical protein